MFGRKIERKSFLYKAMRFLARIGPYVGPLLVPETFDITNIKISYNCLPPNLEGIKILHLSDIHAGDFIRKEYLLKLVDKCNKLDPDLVIITGDFTETEFDDIHWSSEILATINNKLGIYGVYGNHDIWNGKEDIGNLLATKNIKILNNKNTMLNYNDENFYLGGIDDYKFGDPDINLALTGIPEGGFTILMSHNPDAVELLDNYKVDLMLCGHMHGGQWRFPIIGAPYVPSKFKTKHYLGLSKSNDTYIYTTCGIGSTSIPIRINCNPEISLITLTSST